MYIIRLYGKQDVIVVHKRLIWLNFEAKDAEFFFQVRRQLLLCYRIYSTVLYLPDRTTKHNNDFRFVLILVCYSATGLGEAHTNLNYSLAILVLEYYKVRNVTSCFKSKTELRIRFQ